MQRGWKLHLREATLTLVYTHSASTGTEAGEIGVTERSSSVVTSLRTSSEGIFAIDG